MIDLSHCRLMIFSTIAVTFYEFGARSSFYEMIEVSLWGVSPSRDGR